MRYEEEEATPELEFGSHPYGAKPTGNMITESLGEGGFLARKMGLGTLAPLPDEFLLDVLSLFSPRCLGCLAQVSLGLVCFRWTNCSESCTYISFKVLVPPCRNPG